MHWGHKVLVREDGKSVSREATRAEYNIAFGAEVPPEPEIPDAVERIWSLWWRLNNRRPASDSVSPIPCTEIESFSNLTNILFTPEDLKFLEAIDNAYIRSVAEERRSKAERDKEEQDRKAKSGNKPRRR